MKSPTRRVKEKAVKAWAIRSTSGYIWIGTASYTRREAWRSLVRGCADPEKFRDFIFKRGDRAVRIEIRLSKQEKGRKAK